MNYQEAREYIIKSERYIGEMGLENMQNLLDKLGHPEADLSFIHITGTNGKGSVMAYISTVLACAGYRVGRYVSPTLYSYRERIQVNEENISREAFTRLMERVVFAISQLQYEGMAHPSPFEIETALAFLYFREQGCDIVVLECGMGGTYDATNVIQNTVMAVFTSISMDHMEQLGDTLDAIAANKAGILKPHSVAVIGRQEPAVEDRLWAICTEHGNPIIVAKPQEAVVRESTLEQQVFRYHGEEIAIRLAGSHQIENAVLALDCIHGLNRIGYDISREAIQEGFLRTSWNGRFTVLCSNPTIVVDGAHNPAAALMLQQSLKMHFKDRELIFIMGIFEDKQYHKIAEIMAPMAKQIYTIATPDNPRALDAAALAEAVKPYNSQVMACDNLQTAVALSMQLAGTEDVIVAFGSLSFIGAITKIVTGEEYDD